MRTPLTKPQRRPPPLEQPPPIAPTVSVIETAPRNFSARQEGVHALLVKRGGLTVTQLMHATRRGQSTIQFDLRKLVEANRVRVTVPRNRQKFGGGSNPNVYEAIQ